jgi:Phage terminase, small subunit
MAKKPRLTLVNPSKLNPTRTSSTLGPSGTHLWNSIQDEYRIDDAGGRAMLLQICAAVDRAEECAEAIDRDGPMIRTKNGLREHPLLKTEIASRAFVVRSLHRLGLDIEPPRSTPGRPSGTHNPTRA